MIEKAHSRNADSLVVLDFETTGLSPNSGDRAIEIGAVLIEGGRIADRFQQLMNPGRQVSQFISQYTGITNAMLRDAAPCEIVMNEFADFIEGHNLVAHNASFDRCFLDAELLRIGRNYSGGFACSMLAARRLYQDAPNHRLSSLVAYKRLPTDGVFHRALADAEMTAHLWLQMLEDIGQIYGYQDVPFSLMQKLTRTNKKAVAKLLSCK
ncbi:PolC-type DNA polymerase III [Motiliproteus sp. MSK22-1]|uniref:3'-5' exonuclease n=1 Tax=Motiliproteus sp. MSK22-1 TaxID=1897630 RepID=UPI0009767146|nr:3'-5' exonuclease [Motiliproteus sp. MSK22-1]OMH38854.1 DNA polymerase III subunit epsilon [Motiliproteus sp. MSK22-1]